LCGLILPLGLRESVSVGAGMGWYSLSGVMLTDFYGAEVGAVAFMSNLLRELLSFLTIPLAVKYLNPYAAIAQIGRASCRQRDWSSDVCSSDLSAGLSCRSGCGNR